MLSNEQENNQHLRNLPIQEILQKRRSQSKQEQISERVLDYMLPPSQASVSTSTICSGMRRNHKRERVINCSDCPSATRWVKASGDLLALRDRDFGGDFSGALLWQDVL